MAQCLLAAILLDLTEATAFLIADCFTGPDFGADFTVRVMVARLASVLAAADLAAFVDFGF